MTNETIPIKKDHLPLIILGLKIGLDYIENFNTVLNRYGLTDKLKQEELMELVDGDLIFIKEIIGELEKIKE